MRKADEAHYVIAALRAEVAALQAEVDKLRGQLERALATGAKDRGTAVPGPIPDRSRRDQGGMRSSSWSREASAMKRAHA